MTQANTIRPLKKLLIPAFLTLFKRHKFIDAFYSEALYVDHRIDQEQVRKYRDFFNLKEDLPLSYFYLISQAMHSNEMIKKGFPFALPGLLHMESDFELIAEPNKEIPLDIRNSIEIPYKAEGSVAMYLQDEYYQNGELKVRIKHTYLKKRKRKGKRNKEEADVKIYDNWIDTEWKFKRNLGRKYARVSGDYNPIHLASVFAWFFGFRKSIIQGWYLASRAVAEIEAETEMPAKAIQIAFKKAVDLPSTSEFRFRLSSDRYIQFELKSENSSKMQGKIF